MKKVKLLMRQAVTRSVANDNRLHPGISGNRRETIKKESWKMNRIMNSTLKRIRVRGILLAACIISLACNRSRPAPPEQQPKLPVLWTAGGLSAGTDSAGQAARIASDASGNVAVVSGPSGGA